MPDSTKLKNNNNREAIVVTVKYIDDCLAKRLMHLVQSASSPNRDIWILHSHHLVDDPYIVQHSRRLISSISMSISDHEGKVYSINQILSPIAPKFDGSTMIVGTSKSSFLKLASHYGYGSAWLLEDDVFFTGDWRVFFDELDKVDADVLSALHRESHKHPCHVHINGYEQRCHTKTGWFGIRLSGQVVSSLLKDLSSNKASGFHENIIGAYALANNYTIQAIPSKIIGRAVVGHFKKHVGIPHHQIHQLKSHSPILPNKFYHPVKCSAYLPGEFDHVLMNWTNVNWSH